MIAISFVFNPKCRFDCVGKLLTPEHTALSSASKLSRSLKNRKAFPFLIVMRTRKKCFFVCLLNVVISLSNRGGFYFCKAVICQCQSNEGENSFCSPLSAHKALIKNCFRPDSC